jgi:hypothetical protein
VRDSSPSLSSHFSNFRFCSASGPRDSLFHTETGSTTVTGGMANSFLGSRYSVVPCSLPPTQPVLLSSGRNNPAMFRLQPKNAGQDILNCDQSHTCVGAISRKQKEIGNPFLGESRMRRNTLLRLTVAAAIGVSIFASVAYALTWVAPRSGTSSALSGTRAELK